MNSNNLHVDNHHINNVKNKELIHIRIVELDSYLCAPLTHSDYLLCPYNNSPIQLIPIIRCYGLTVHQNNTNIAQHVCLHIHNVLPYFYVNIDLSDLKDNCFLLTFANSLNAAITQFHANKTSTASGTGQGEKRQITINYVYNVELVSGKPFYGYHSGEQLYLKVILLDPSAIKISVNILTTGAVMNRIFQTHQSHIPYLLQFLVDYNLYGMNLLDLSLSMISFRRPLPHYYLDPIYHRKQLIKKTIGVKNKKDLVNYAYENIEIEEEPERTAQFHESGLLLSSTVPTHLLSSMLVQKTTNCDLECDVQAQFILNAHYVDKEEASSSPCGRLVESLKSIWENERKRRADWAEENCITNLTQLTPNPTPARLNHVETELEAAYKLHLAAVANSEMPFNQSFQPLSQFFSPSSQQQHEHNDAAPLIQVDSELLLTQAENEDLLNDNSEAANELIDQPVQENAAEEENDWEYTIQAADVEEDIKLSQLHGDSALIPQLDGGADDSHLYLHSILNHRYSQPQDAIEYYVELVSAGSLREYVWVKGEEISSRKDLISAYHIKINSSSSTSPLPIANKPKSPASGGNQQLIITHQQHNIPSPSSLAGKPLLTCNSISNNCDEIESISSVSSLEAESIDSISVDEEQTRPRFKHDNIYNSGNSSLTRPAPSLINHNISNVGIIRKLHFDDEQQTNSNSAKERSETNFVEYNDSTASGWCDNDDKTALLPRPPTVEQLLNSFSDYNLPSVVHDEPFYSNDSHHTQHITAINANLAVAHYQASIQMNNNTITRNPNSPQFLTNHDLTAYCTELTPPTHIAMPLVINHCNFGNQLYWDRNDYMLLHTNYSNQYILATPPPSFPQINPSRRHSVKSSSPINSSLPPASPKHEEYYLSNMSYFLPSAAEPSASSASAISNPLLMQSSNDSHQNLTLLSIEIHTESRGQLLSDPSTDAVAAIVYSIRFDIDHLKCNVKNTDMTGILINRDVSNLPRLVLRDDIIIQLFANEQQMINGLVHIVQQLDIDIIVGFELQKASLGYLFDRVKLAYNRNLSLELSRIKMKASKLPPSAASAHHSVNAAERYAINHGQNIRVSGRIVLNLWRVMRDEVKLNLYTLENVAAQVLKLKLPKYAQTQLNSWWKNDDPRISASAVHRVLHYYVTRVKTNFELIDRLDIIGRTSELARVFGIRFYSVLERGSQYRVESMMLRLAKRNHYILPALTPQQRSNQPAMECMPLIMEPISRYYSSPLVVLDFQSLYPSMIIAYNLCYSTCLGRLPQLNHNKLRSEEAFIQFKFGGQTLSRERGELHSLKDSIYSSPNGVMFVRPSHRVGILPQLLKEILNTRIMIKESMKREEVNNNKALRGVLNARQFALKLIANVTYGYTAAGYSGRMPCAEIADSIVAAGRETLERAVELVEGNAAWHAKVVYSDTDSLFVLLPGRSKEEAFTIGGEIASAVTAANPSPVRLQLEKVYLPSCLIAKKRYVGNKFDSAAQQEGTLDCKGLELVRRDGCDLLVRTQSKVIKLLFTTQDLTLIRNYLYHQFTRITQQEIDYAQFIFAKEVRLGSYKQPPIAALIALNQMKADPRAEPLYNERVPYIIADHYTNHSNSTLREKALAVQTLLAHQHLYTVASSYYIEKVLIPPLQRILQIIGVDVSSWYQRWTRPKTKLSAPLLFSHTQMRRTINDYYATNHCIHCDSLIQGVNSPLCNECKADPMFLVYSLTSALSQIQAKQHKLIKVCGDCMNSCYSRSAATVYSNYDKNSSSAPQLNPLLPHVECVNSACSLYFDRCHSAWISYSSQQHLAAAIKSLQ
jgi:DNA polymerase elongation subunit (family B)